MNVNKWDSKNISDQTGKTAIITGSNSGIGLETAKVLAGKNATIIMAVRNLDKGQAALDTIKGQYPTSKVIAIKLNLAALSSVKAFVDKFKETHSRLDLLINNAGVMVPPYQKTADGFELQMGTNHLGPFALTGMLMDLIKQTPCSRIVNVSSIAHKGGSIDFDDLHWEKRKYKKWSAYGDSKIANLYFTYALQKRLNNENSNVIVTAAHPGWTATDLQRHSGLFSRLNPLFAQTIPMGALPTLYAATAPDVRGKDFFGPSGFMEIKGYPKKVQSNSRSKSPDLTEKLWKISEKLTNVTF
ncbi:MAG: SDR family NAD(P)-dependent oxidoreductase [Deltaproteobacteria bacterium]|jgi:NAD(P)-dependent dehydrogenase (short-subunit alcohol dehydrogenase family)|nr:SDR family NAD(P)-dependent oxidoreductase [Deltaproteobacteria bacterium]